MEAETIPDPVWQGSVQSFRLYYVDKRTN